MSTRNVTLPILVPLLSALHDRLCQVPFGADAGVIVSWTGYESCAGTVNSDASGFWVHPAGSLECNVICRTESVSLRRINGTHNVSPGATCASGEYRSAKCSRLW